MLEVTRPWTTSRSVRVPGGERCKKKRKVADYFPEEAALTCISRNFHSCTHVGCVCPCIP